MRVLVVDDFAPLTDQLAKVIGQAGHEVVAAYSGEEALRVTEQFSPDALISDIAMPEMNGVELLCALGEKFPGCRTLLVTATQFIPEVFIGGLRVKVLQKPFDVETVLGFLSGQTP